MLLAMFLMLGLAVPDAEMPPTEPPVIPATIVRTAPAPGSESDTRHKLLALINRTRGKAGLPALEWDGRLAAAAREHASLMSERGALSHQFEGEPALLERLSAQGVRLDRASENVVYDITVEGAHENFMSSAPHRENLLNPAFNAVGIGIVEVGGILYIAEDFSHSLPEVADNEATQLVAAGFEEMRRSVGAPELLMVSNTRLENIALAIAQGETLSSAPALKLPDARFAASYATADPSKLPPSVARLTAVRGLTHYSVSAHYSRTPKYPGGLYWVTIVLFHSSEIASR